MLGESEEDAKEGGEIVTVPKINLGKIASNLYFMNLYIVIQKKY